MAGGGYWGTIRWGGYFWSRAGLVMWLAVHVGLITGVAICESGCGWATHGVVKGELIRCGPISGGGFERGGGGDRY